MPRLIELQRVEDVGSPLAIRVGDLLLVRASGGRVREGGESVEVLGPFVGSVVGTTGTVVTPMGGPDSFLVRARAPGAASLDVFTGDPFRSPRGTVLRLEVEA